MIFLQLHIYTLIILIVMLLTFGIIFSILSVKTDKTLRNSLIFMAIAYFWYAAGNILDIYLIEDGKTLYDDYKLDSIMTTMVIGMGQIFFLPYALLNMINAKKFSVKNIFPEFFVLLCFALTLLAVSFVFKLPVFAVELVIYSSIPLLIYMLFRYYYIFFKTWRIALNNLQNYYSGNEIDRLMWINTSFHITLFVGISAVINSLFATPVVVFYFKILYFFLYLFLALRFIRFVLADEICEEAFEFESDGDKILPHTAAVKTIECNLPAFLEKKQFTQPGITIDDVAKILGTNRAYLSKYINTAQNKTFSQWINELRIEYSKNLMRENSRISLSNVAQESGFSHRSHFTNLFTQNTGMSPSQWKKNF